jgi:hypothetical protein
MKFKIFAALREDINNGHVWIKMENQNPPKRRVVRITHLVNKRKVFCEAIHIGDNFLAHYNQPGRAYIREFGNSIVINEWYRVKLGILKTQSEEDLDIEIANGWWGRLWACLQHPQEVVRLAIWLGLLSVFLGFLGVVPVKCLILKLYCVLKLLFSGLCWILKLLKVA